MTASKGVYAPRSFAPLAEKLEADSMPEPNSGCLLWLGRVDKDGYGRVSIPVGRHAKTHRAAYELARGPIPAGLKVCHKCDVPACINPAHLFLGSTKDNSDDMVRKGRARGKVSRGSTNGSAKLTEEEVARIKASSGSNAAVAKMFAVSASTIWNIRNGVRWTHVNARAA